MKNSKLVVSKIESFSCVDGPGIRTVVFFNNCPLRCKFCHNPEMQQEFNKLDINYQKLYKLILSNKPYYKNSGGVTFSGGEPLLSQKSMYKLVKKLKKENINIALDTSGYSKKINLKLLKMFDYILLDIKSVYPDKFNYLTGGNIELVDNFINKLNEINTKVIIRVVIIPGINDTKEYMNDLKAYISKIKNIVKVDFLPFHTLGFSKYKEYGIENPFENMKAMDENKCNALYKYFLEI